MASGARVIIIADVDVFAAEAMADVLERHGYHARIAPPVHSAVRDWVREYSADVCIIDLALRDGDHLDNVGLLLTEHPAVKVIVRTAETSSDVMQAALALGVSGYVHKSKGPVVLLETITRVANGEVVVEGSFTRTLEPNHRERAQFLRLVDDLTPRQRQCLEMIADGKGTIAMAADLGVSVATVRTHVQATLAKLGVRSRLEAATLVAKNQVPEMT